jgi:hypothetical protein
MVLLKKACLLLAELFLLLLLILITSQIAIAQLQEEWVARYNGPTNGYDSASGMAVDIAGNVYVTGSTPGSGGASDYATVKYDAGGNVLWAVRYNGPGDFNDNAHAIAVDAEGNVYVTGESTGSDGNYDYATIKYDTDGNTLWVKRNNGPANGWDYAVAIAVDSSSNVYVTGYQAGADGTSDSDYATIKYDTAGNALWVATYNGPASGSDNATAIVLDADGHVYVTGESDGSDYATIKYDAGGNALWVARYSFSRDYPAALAVDAAGNVYVTGSACFSHGLPAPDLVTCVYATVKYDEGGNQLWSATYHGIGDLFAPLNHAVALAVDAAGNVYVTGSSEAAGTGPDYATIKYDAYGSEVWVARYNGPANGLDTAAAIVAHSDGHVYVTGTSAGSDGSMDYATIQYDANGNELGVSRHSGPEHGADTPIALAVDSSGSVYVTGSSQGFETSMDYVTIKLSPGNDSNSGNDSNDGGASGGCFIAASAKDPSGLNTRILFELVFCWTILLFSISFCGQIPPGEKHN